MNDMGFIKNVGPCSVPMWSAGLPSGCCGNEAHGVHIEGQEFRDAWTGELRRHDGKYNGFVSGLACVQHGGPEETGPRVFEDGTNNEGRRMWCAVYEDFENLHESPAEFSIHAWLAIKRLGDNHPKVLNDE